MKCLLCLTNKLGIEYHGLRDWYESTMMADEALSHNLVVKLWTDDVINNSESKICATCSKSLETFNDLWNVVNATNNNANKLAADVKDEDISMNISEYQVNETNNSTETASPRPAKIFRITQVRSLTAADDTSTIDDPALTPTAVPAQEKTVTVSQNDNKSSKIVETLKRLLRNTEEKLLQSEKLCKEYVSKYEKLKIESKQRLTDVVHKYNKLKHESAKEIKSLKQQVTSKDKLLDECYLSHSESESESDMEKYQSLPDLGPHIKPIAQLKGAPANFFYYRNKSDLLAPVEVRYGTGFSFQFKGHQTSFVCVDKTCKRRIHCIRTENTIKCIKLPFGKHTCLKMQMLKEQRGRKKRRMRKTK